MVSPPWTHHDESTVDPRGLAVTERVQRIPHFGDSVCSTWFLAQVFRDWRPCAYTLDVDQTQKNSNVPYSGHHFSVFVRSVCNNPVTLSMK